MPASADEPLDARHVLARLLHRYPNTWTYLVDGLVGATPELLIRRQGSLARRFGRGRHGIRAHAVTSAATRRSPSSRSRRFSMALSIR